MKIIQRRTTRTLALTLLSVGATACTDPIVGQWEGDCVGSDERAAWEMTIDASGEGELESREPGHSGADDADISWEASSDGKYELEIEWETGSNDWDCELRRDDTKLVCELTHSSHEATCKLNLQD